MQRGHNSKDIGVLDYAFVGLLGILLGVPYALTKISQTTIPPITGVAARVSLAAISLWIVVLASKLTLCSLRRYIPLLLLQGCISCAIPYSLIAYGQLSVNSGIAAILNSTTPVFVFFIGLSWIRHESLSFSRLLGASTGLMGVKMITGSSSFSGIEGTLGQAAIILATICSAIAAIQGRRLDDVPPVLTAAGTLTVGAFLLVPIGFVVESPLHTAPSAASIIALVVNAVLGTALRSVVYFRLLRTIGSMGTTSASYLKPAVGLLAGCAIVGEPLTWITTLGLAVIFLGVVMINQPQAFLLMRRRLMSGIDRRSPKGASLFTPSTR